MLTPNLALDVGINRLTFLDIYLPTDYCPGQPRLELRTSLFLGIASNMCTTKKRGKKEVEYIAVNKKS